MKWIIVWNADINFEYATFIWTVGWPTNLTLNFHPIITDFDHHTRIDKLKNFNLQNTVS